MPNNQDNLTVKDFGKEWSMFNQSPLLQKTELETIFNNYFSIFPWESLSPNATGYDLGCGSGRWASIVATRVGKLYCVDASKEALSIAKSNLKNFNNIEFFDASVDQMPIADNTMDFGYSLGVLHHVPDTQAGIRACVQKLKKGAPLLLYLYYAFDNKPRWFRLVWKISDIVRKIVSKLPFFLKYILSQVIALLIYLPLARFARLCDRCGYNVSNFPLSSYRERSLYVMRTDALDRFGTRLEKRFTKSEIISMMKACGLENISFSDTSPFWCAVGYKKI